MTTGRATSNGLELAYETFGSRSDPAIVLVMGLGTPMIAWRDEFCRILAERGFFVVRFDNRDVGESTHLADLPVPNPVSVLVGRTDPPYRLEDMAQDVVGLLDALDLSVVHLVGASMGGFIAQHVALRDPERIATLTLMMTSTGSKLVGGTSREVIAAMLRRKPASTRDEAIAAGAAMQRLIESPAYPLSQEDLVAMAGGFYDRGYDADGTSRQFAALIDQTNRTRALADLTVPTLIMHGLSDRLINVSGGVALAKVIAGSRLVAFNGMGHDLPSALWPEFVDHIVALTERATNSVAAQPLPAAGIVPSDPGSAVAG